MHAAARLNSFKRSRARSELSGRCLCSLIARFPRGALQTRRGGQPCDPTSVYDHDGGKIADSAMADAHDPSARGARVDACELMIAHAFGARLEI